MKLTGAEPRPILVIALILGLLTGCSSGLETQRIGKPRSGSSVQDLRFVDVAHDVGLVFRHGAFRWDVSGDPAAMMGAGICWLDYDDDGWLDLYVVNSYSQREAARWEDEGGLPRSALFHNVEGRFVDVSEGSGADLSMRGMGCVAADLDRDGHTDLYVTTANQGRLLWNEGDGSFEEGTRAAGVEAFGWHTGAAVGDVNGDGWPDLFVSGYVDLNTPIPGATQGFPSTYGGVRDLLYLSKGMEEGGVAFREVGVEAGLEVVNFGYGLGAVFSDLDRDDDLDLYIANDTNPNRLYKNVAWPGGARADPAGLGFRFEDVAARAGVADPNAGMGIAEADYDGDEQPDLFVTNARGQLHAAFRGQTSELVDPSFVDSRADFGQDLAGSTGWGTSWADLDLDADLDLVLVNGNIPVTDLIKDAQPVEAFENLAETTRVVKFSDASVATGLADVGALLARGSAAADYDNDGDVDIAINSIGGSLVLLENTATGGNSLEVALEGSHPGARITAVLPGGRRLIREARAGSSYLSSEDPRPHFGLGPADEVARLVVEWPDGQRTVLKDLAANQIVSVVVP